MIAFLTMIVRYEITLWVSLFRWLTRRAPRPGTFGHTGPVSVLYAAFIVVSAIEVPVAHVILPWASVRSVVLFIGIYGLLWMIGAYAILRVHPHEVTEAGLRVRNGASTDILVPWSAVASIRAQFRPQPSNRAVQLHDGILHVVVGSQTTVDVTFHEPRRLPTSKGPSEPVTGLRFHADDAAGLVARAREHVTSPVPEPGAR